MRPARKRPLEAAPLPGVAPLESKAPPFCRDPRG